MICKNNFVNGSANLINGGRGDRSAGTAERGDISGGKATVLNRFAEGKLNAIHLAGRHIFADQCRYHARARIGGQRKGRRKLILCRFAVCAILILVHRIVAAVQNVRPDGQRVGTNPDLRIEVNSIGRAIDLCHRIDRDCTGRPGQRNNVSRRERAIFDCLAERECNGTRRDVGNVARGCRRDHARSLFVQRRDRTDPRPIDRANSVNVVLKKKTRAEAAESTAVIGVHNRRVAVGRFVVQPQRMP